MNAITSFKTGSATSHFVKSKLGKLHVVETGTGSEVILLWPSIFTDHHIYDEMISNLSARFTFLLVDGPGHGESEGVSHEFNMEDCANAAISVLDHFLIERAVVGGTSWGGLTAASIALNNPERVKALLLMNTPMEIGTQKPSFSTRMIAFGARWMIKSKMFRDGVARSFFSANTLTKNSQYENLFHTMLKQAQPDRLSAAVRSVILRGSPLKERMANLSVPTLVIAGEKDEMYPIEIQAEAALCAPLGEFQPVPGKHISPVDEPTVVANAIAQFVVREVQQ